MTRKFEIGDAVHCVDNASRPDWAEWYGDGAYSEDMLSKSARYIVKGVSVRDGMVGVDVGVPTPWGDPYWSADRFRHALLREASTAIPGMIPDTEITRVMQDTGMDRMQAIYHLRARKDVVRQLDERKRRVGGL